MPMRLRLDEIELYGRIKLAEDSGRELVIGAIEQIKPFRPESIFENQVSPDAFEEFDRPGHIKAAGSFQVRPFGRDRSLLSYEARVRATDVAARRRLFRAIDLMSPLIGLEIAGVLEEIKNVVEERQGIRR
jgi:hypothetical protein